MSWLAFLVLFLFAQVAVAQDDTAKIQAEMNAGGNVTLSSGVFVVKPIEWPANLNELSGGPPEAPTTLVLAPNQGPWARLVSCIIKGSADRKIVIKNLRIDMNRDEQGWDGKLNLAHQAGMFFGAEKDKGRLTVDVENVRIWDSAADGVYTHHNTTTNWRKLYLTRCYRAGFAVTGKNCIAYARDSKWIECGIDSEPNSDGHAVNIVLDNIELDEMDLFLSARSSFYATDITYNGKLFYLLCHPTAKFFVADSKFKVLPGTARLKVRLVGDTEFLRCIVTGSAGLGNLFNLVWDEDVKDPNSAKTNQHFLLKESLLIGPATTAVDLGIDYPDRKNLFELDNVRIEGTTTAYVTQKKPGVPRKITNSTLNGVPIQ